jgi:hypothetical protein
MRVCARDTVRVLVSGPPSLGRVGRCMRQPSSPPFSESSLVTLFAGISCDIQLLDAGGLVRAAGPAGRRMRVEEAAMRAMPQEGNPFSIRNICKRSIAWQRARGEVCSWLRLSQSLSRRQPPLSTDDNLSPTRSWRGPTVHASAGDFRVRAAAGPACHAGLKPHRTSGGEHGA